MNYQISTSQMAETVSVEALARSLGTFTATLIGPVDRGNVVLGIEFYEALDELPEAPGTLLLAPSNESLEYRWFAPLAEAAAQRRYAGIAVKCQDGDLPVVQAVASNYGIPVIRVHRHVSWRLLEAQLDRLVGEERTNQDSFLERGDEQLYSLTNELAEFYGGSVVVEDIGRRIIAYSSLPGQRIDSLRTHGILSREVPESLYNDDQYRSLFRSNVALGFPEENDTAARIAIAIRAGALPLGSIWAIVAPGSEQVTAEREERMQRAAEVAAAHMLDSLKLTELGRLPREDLFRRMLTGTDLTGTELSELGIVEENGAALLTFEPNHDTPIAIAHLRSTISKQLSLQHPETVVMAQEGRIHALIQERDALQAVEEVVRALPLVDRLVGNLGRVAVTGIATRAIEVSEYRQQAVLLLEAAKRSHSARRVVTVESERTSLVLGRATSVFEQDHALLNPAVSRLVENPSGRGVAETLETWINCARNVTLTASTLGVHENTVRKRLEQCREKYAIQLDTTDQIFAVWLQLRWAKAQR